MSTEGDVILCQLNGLLYRLEIVSSYLSCGENFCKDCVKSAMENSNNGVFVKVTKIMYVGEFDKRI
jgi:hypothetical protein